MDMNPQICDSPVWNISKRNVFLTLLSLFQNLHRLTSIWYLDPILSSVMNQINNVFKIIAIQLIANFTGSRVISKKSYKFVEAKTKFCRKHILQEVRGGESLCIIIKSLVIKHKFSSTVIRDFLGFVLNLQCLSHDCNHYQDENKEKMVDVKDVMLSTILTLARTIENK